MYAFTLEGLGLGLITGKKGLNILHQSNEKIKSRIYYMQ